MNEELEKMKTLKYNWMVGCIILGVCFAISVGINIDQERYLKESIKSAKNECDYKYAVVHRNLDVKRHMLSFAVSNMYMYNIKSYPETMQKMIIAAMDGKKNDFDFYVRRMQEEYVKEHEKK